MKPTLPCCLLTALTPATVAFPSISKRMFNLVFTVVLCESPLYSVLGLFTQLFNADR